MAKPPSTPSSSDIDGVDRDWRPGLTDEDSDQQPAQKVQDAEDDSAARPPDTLDQPKGASQGS